VEAADAAGSSGGADKGAQGFVLFFSLGAEALAKAIPCTLEDRERLIRVETKLDEMAKRFEQRFEQIDKRFEQIEARFGRLVTLFLGIVGAFAGVVAVTISFAIWDRRTALAPALWMSRSLEEREERLERALREFSEKEPRLAEILRRLGLL
jgi:hypothetical protein